MSSRCVIIECLNMSKRYHKMSRRCVIQNASICQRGIIEYLNISKRYHRILQYVKQMCHHGVPQYAESYVNKGKM